MSEIKIIGGRAMVPSGAADGSYIEVGGPYDAATVKWHADRQREQWAAEREARFAAAVAADRQEDARLAERQRQHEAGLREQAELEEAGVRASVEADLRRGGCPEADVRRLAGEAMRSFHLEKARETATAGGRAERAMRSFFLRQAAAASHFD